MVHFVQFATKAQEFPSSCNLTEESTRSMWYSKKELKDIQKQNKKTIQLSIEKHGDSEECCLRGLSNSEETSHRKQCIRESREALFREQNIQMDEGSIDEELLADEYIETCVCTKEDAYQRGLEDAMDILDYVGSSKAIVCELLLAPTRSALKIINGAPTRIQRRSFSGRAA